MKKSIYEQNGYKNREEYLHSLAEDYGIPYDFVLNLAEILGPTEDFDGLVSELEDVSDSFSL